MIGVPSCPKGVCLLVCFCYTEDWERELSRDYGLYSFFFVCLRIMVRDIRVVWAMGLIYVVSFSLRLFASFVLDVLVGFVTCFVPVWSLG